MVKSAAKIKAKEIRMLVDDEFRKKMTTAESQKDLTPEEHAQRRKEKRLRRNQARRALLHRSRMAKKEARKEGKPTSTATKPQPKLKKTRTSHRQRLRRKQIRLGLIEPDAQDVAKALKHQQEKLKKGHKGGKRPATA
eukprot:NODE_4447_length_579_cov_274.264151_g3225_i0.p1 GENE.NODE_4447_length_579_cov_274.264151_g3225_i0~~NODE_4447_length_579_cov_274.264151_g3225_i0.p1  ORF type:complete len:154 (-),score=67.80 NODE_4447_length_579_cov_274.264151_g3225_i0:118-531(-)